MLVAIITVKSGTSGDCISLSVSVLVTAIGIGIDDTDKQRAVTFDIDKETSQLFAHLRGVYTCSQPLSTDPFVFLRYNILVHLLPIPLPIASGAR